jgi:NADPH:quinone reductase-like Zn-dependent oxidoreductase
MRAIVIKQYGGPEVLEIQERPVPEPKPGHVLIEVKAFGLNHAEIYFRKGVWGDVSEISGIECVGLVKEDPDGGFSRGQKVVALVGGMPNTPWCRQAMWRPSRPICHGKSLRRSRSRTPRLGLACTAIWR